MQCPPHFERVHVDRGSSSCRRSGTRSASGWSHSGGTETAEWVIADLAADDSVRLTMPNADFFAALGFFVRRGFLDPETSARLRAEVRGAPVSAATVRTDDRVYDVDRATRSTDWAEVAPEAVELVERRLAAVMPEVSRHYGIPLTGLQPVQFLVYRAGDFFERHRDRGEGDDTPGFSRARGVAAIIFLNGEGDPSTSDAYRGGALTLYGLFEQPDAETLGFPLEAEEGLLATFPADVTHEVRRVEAGERYTVVTWFEKGSA